MIHLPAREWTNNWSKRVRLAALKSVVCTEHWFPCPSRPMGGARKFQLGGSRGQRAGQGGQAYGQGHLDFFYSGVGGHAYWQAQNARPSGICIWHCPPLGKIAVFCKGSATFVHFWRRGTISRAERAENKNVTPNHTSRSVDSWWHAKWRC